MDTLDSNPYRLTNSQLTQPLPALSAVYCTTCPSVELPTEQAGEVGLVDFL